MLQSAQVALTLQEDHNFWIDQRVMYRVRRVWLELGRRFAAAGVLAEPNDIFYLTPGESRAVAGEAPMLDQRDLVRRRQSEEQRQRTLRSPLLLGTIPPGPPPDDPVVRMAGKFWGMPPRPAGQSDELHGAVGSPGVARGTARVVIALAEAGTLRHGDILVAETTAPPWTPLFATAAAVVTDTGGALSHCAIVAREYRIPAVVGTSLATSVIRDGDILEVDGNRGIVRILANAPGRR
jgi:pyruvate,water dikinase